MKKVLLAMLLAVVVAMPAYASVQNVKVSGDIESTYVVRNQFDLGHQTMTEKYRSNFLLTQTRVRVDADLTDNVQTTVGLINERVWGEETEGSNGDNDIDLNLAYVTLKEMLYSPLTVIIGRHNFAFGNSFVMDSTGTNNNTSMGGLNSAAEDLTKRSTLDSVHAILDYNPLKIDLIAAIVDQNTVAGTGAHKDDVKVYGSNASYQLGDKWQTMVEGYYWAKIDQSTNTAAGAKSDTIYLPGIHVSTNPIKGLNLSAEVAMQRGNKSVSAGTNIKREAQAAQVIANYALPISKLEKYSPMLMGVYTYVSGEKNSSEAGNSPIGDETRHTAWDPFFENQAGGAIYNTLFNLSNAHIITTKLSAKPIEDVTASVQLDNLWLDKEVQGGVLPILRPDGTTLNTVSTTNMFLGSELGLGLSYAYTDDVTLGAKFNWFNPGEAFSSVNQNVASQILVNANVNF